ncbi:MAG: cyclic nucleotide-binding domain-containing protein [Deltaproteobacteria bacterium]|nr:cyclic nucleotide-binding domain-containing protein [Deltaproteobacteria bacterium]
MTKSKAQHERLPTIQAAMEIGDWDRLTSLYEIQEFEHVETFLGKGEKNRNLYFLLEGNAQAIIDERNDIINRIEAGEFIGEVSFLDGLPTTAPVLAESGSRIACIDGKALLDLCRSDTRFAGRLYKYLALLLARRLRRNTSIVREIGIKHTEHTIAPSTHVIRIDDFEFRQLDCEDEIQEAMHLLHTIYVLEQGWIPLESNPSRVRIKSLSGRKMLVDKFSYTAHWFGAFHKGHLVGCFRVLPYPLHELKEYRDLPLFLAHSGVSELNRLAVAPAYRGHKFVMLLLARIACDHALLLGPVTYVTAPTPEPAKLFENLGLTRASLPPFKYNMKETGEVDLLYHDSRSSDPNLTLLFRLSDKLLRRDQTEGGLR